MIERRLEPELMLDEEQAMAYANADFEEAHNFFITCFKNTFDLTAPKGKVLDLGCGPADISIRMAKAFPDIEIQGVDGSEAMLEPGRLRIAQLGLAQRIKLTRCYLPTDELPETSYQTIISNSLLHHLPDASVLWQTIKDYSVNGTRIFIMDLMRPTNEQQAQDLVDMYAIGEPEILRHDFYYSLLAAFTVEEVRQQLIEAGLSSLNVRAVTDRHLTVSGIMA